MQERRPLLSSEHLSGHRPLMQQQQSRSDPCCSGAKTLVVCVTAAFLVVFYAQKPQQPMTIIESVRPLKSLGEHGQFVPPAQNAEAIADVVTPAVKSPPAASTSNLNMAEHESSQPLAVLNRERKRAGGDAFSEAFHVYRPPEGAVKPGGDLDDPNTLGVAVKAAAADGEIMLLCIGGSGSMRTGMNLVYNFRTMGLYHMLILAPERKVCIDSAHHTRAAVCAIPCASPPFSRIARGHVRKHRYASRCGRRYPRSHASTGRRSSRSRSPIRSTIRCSHDTPSPSSRRASG